MKKNIKNTLTDKQYAITQKHQTEPPFSGEYLNHTQEGIYKCVVCNNDLFSSKSKYNSGTGWPSFYEPILNNAIGKTIDIIYINKK